MAFHPDREVERPPTGDWVLLVAHDVRNLLHSVAGIAETLERGERDAARAEQLRALRYQAGHAATLTEDVLRRAMGAPPQPLLELDLGTAALSASAALHARAGRSLRVELVDPGERVLVRGREHDVVRAICNLMWNALEAMHGAGAAEPRVDLRWGRDAHGPFLEVRDYGPGMPEGAAPRRAAAREDGLVHGYGLASVRQVMEEHGGSLRAAQAPEGRGAVMRLQFGVQRVLDFGA